MEQVTVIGALVGGFVSFASPCVLPLVPGYVSYISGLTLDEIAAEESHHRVPPRVLWNAIAFILGFSAIFIAMGAVATSAGQLLVSYRHILGRIAGVIVILFGLHLIGLLKLSFIYRIRGFQNLPARTGLFGSSFVLGAAISFGWLPCIGPVLATILTMAAAQETVREGVGLLCLYSLGLGIPFFLSALAIPVFLSGMKRFRRHIRTVEILAGCVLVILGVLLVADRMTIILNYLPQWDFGGRL
ncbi:MAG: cytochrome c biogenesis protein CcdA [Deltaproteobacteria bacterium]|nr:cytochrome c biogenesis protein CcdA [Deltaproteobacteria bacterium]